MLYKTFKSILGPILRLVFRIKVQGIENIPASGGVIIAANHQAVIDSFIVQQVIDRKVLFAAKKEYYEQKGIWGWLKKQFFSIGAFPIDRSDVSPQGLEKALTVMSGIVLGGGILGIHPEGTRAPYGAVYRGKRSVIDVAWRTNVPIVPISLIGTHYANPPTSRMPRFRAKIEVVVGQPMYFKKPELAITKGLVSRAQTAQMKSVMEVIAANGRMTYVHEDAQSIKEAPKK